MAHRLRARLVLGAVDEQQGILAPVGVLLSELGGKLRDKEAERTAVGVRLRYGAVKAPACADCELHGEARVDRPRCLRVPLALKTPLAPAEVEMVEPGLVKVEYANSARQLRQHELGIMLPE